MKLNISKILDEHLPADGVGTEREQLRMNIHREISDYAAQQVSAERERIKNIVKDNYVILHPIHFNKVIELIDSL